MTYHRVCNKVNNTTGAISGSETVDLPGAPEFIPRFIFVILVGLNR